MLPYIDILLKNDLFQGISAAEAERLIDFDTCTQVKYNKGSLIFQEMDICEAIGFILAGSVNIHQIAASGNSLTFTSLSAGNSFGEGALFAPDPSFHFSISAKEKTTVLYMPQEQIKKLLGESSIFSTNYIAFLSQRLQFFKHKLQILSQKDVRTRLLIYLAYECRKAGSLSFKPVHTRTEIAEYIGVARPSVPRELKHMQRDGLIRLKGKEITILKPELIHFS